MSDSMYGVAPWVFLWGLSGIVTSRNLVPLFTVGRWHGTLSGGVTVCGSTNRNMVLLLVHWPPCGELVN
jgi:hypothetical protein